MLCRRHELCPMGGYDVSAWWRACQHTVRLDLRPWRPAGPHRSGEAGPPRRGARCCRSSDTSYGWTTDFPPAVPWTMLAGRRGRPRPMSDAAGEIADKVVKIVAERLGVQEAKVVPE